MSKRIKLTISDNKTILHGGMRVDDNTGLDDILDHVLDYVEDFKTNNVAPSPEWVVARLIEQLLSKRNASVLFPITDSEAITALEYDFDNGLAKVTFSSDDSAQYYISLDKFVDWIKAPSKGRFYHWYIKDKR